MKNTDQTLLEQMRITEFEIVGRMRLFSITADDQSALKSARPLIEQSLDDLVTQFYHQQTAVPETALLIGDSDTLNRLHHFQRKYLLDLFSGYYDLEYVNNRLRIGLVHKRIRVEPKLYLSAVQTMENLLCDLIDQVIPHQQEQQRVKVAIRKILMFDISFVFDTYVRSLIAEIEASKEKAEQYASLLEQKVKERTQQLETLSRTDSLTGLLNTRHLAETLTRAIRAAERRRESVTVAYLDVNDFKKINDTQGHQRGDEILRIVAKAIKQVSRLEDSCFRYGGDEFCVVMPNCTMHETQEAWAARLRRCLHAQEETLTLSIGCAQTGPHEYVDAEELIRQADEQMYLAKKAGKNSHA